MSASGDPVPAVTEAEAIGEIAAIYADIRATFGVDVVNLVWRHLATIDGALPWCWSAVKPLYVDGIVPAAAAALREALPMPAIPPWPSACLLAVGIDGNCAPAIRRILASYDQTNPMALIALTALAQRLDGAAAAPARIDARRPIPRIEGGLPTLLPVHEMAPATAGLVIAIDALGRRPGEVVVASMYRHLAHWPGYLALAYLQLATLQADGRLAALIDAARDLGRAAAMRIAGALAVPAQPLDPAAARAARDGLELFVGAAIARMTPIGGLLRRLMPA
ncbi:MAG: hypothetical protein AB7O45_14910 [Alphaproteobacteria bacterium]